MTKRREAEETSDKLRCFDQTRFARTRADERFVPDRRSDCFALIRRELQNRLN